MAELRLGRIAEITGGQIVQGNPSTVFREFNIDSRLTKRGELFFAIVARRNGHDYVPAAAERGAGGAVVSQPVRLPDREFALLQVRDTLNALQTLAKTVLVERDIKVVAITGSVGKTTTKEFTAELLSKKFRVLKSEGNFNNHLGLALSLLGIEPHHEVAVLEMAMSGQGEIRALTEIAPPDVAVITNINPAHLEFLKSLDNIAAAKREILEGIKTGGTAVLNNDDPYVAKIGREWSGRKIMFGFSDGCDIQARNIQRRGYDGFRFHLRYGSQTHRVRFAFLAEGHLYNLLAAVGAASAFSIPFESIEKAIQDLRPFPKRGILFRLDKDIVLIDDSYNSNPKALETALRSFAELPARRKVAVLGDMLELGEAEIRFHEEAGRFVVQNGWNILVTIGRLGRRMAAAALAVGMRPDRVFSFMTSDEAADKIFSLLDEGDLILVKGSRGIQTEKIVEKIKETLKER